MALLGASEARIRYSAENLDFKSLSTARRTAGSSSNARIKGFLAITSPSCRQRRTQRLSRFDARTGQCDTTKQNLDGSGTANTQRMMPGSAPYELALCTTYRNRLLQIRRANPFNEFVLIVRGHRRSFLLLYLDEQ